MSLKLHLKIALEWLRLEEEARSYNLVTHCWRIGQPSVFLTREAQSIVDYFLNQVPDLDHPDLPEGESLRPHYYGIRLAAMTEAILELEELLDE